MTIGDPPIRARVAAATPDKERNMSRDVTDPDRVPTENSRTDHFLSIYEWSEHGTFLLS